MYIVVKYTFRSTDYRRRWYKKWRTKSKRRRMRKIRRRVKKKRGEAGEAGIRTILKNVEREEIIIRGGQERAAAGGAGVEHKGVRHEIPRGAGEWGREGRKC